MPELITQFGQLLQNSPQNVGISYWVEGIIGWGEFFICDWIGVSLASLISAGVPWRAPLSPIFRPGGEGGGRLGEFRRVTQTSSPNVKLPIGPQLFWAAPALGGAVGHPDPLYLWACNKSRGGGSSTAEGAQNAPFVINITKYRYMIERLSLFPTAQGP